MSNSQPVRPAALPAFDTQRALRRRRTLRTALWVLAALGLASVLLNHRLALPGPDQFDQRRVRVIRVVDGDTIVIEMPDGTSERVRLHGVDAPELGNDNRPADYWADRSKQYLTARIDQKEVVLRVDDLDPRDRFGRLLALVYLNDSECINLSLVRDGQAYADRRFGGFMQSQLIQAENCARTKQTGLWKQVRDDQQPAWRQAWLEKR